MGACSSTGVQRGVPDHPRANTSVQERRAPEQHPQHGVEGRTPHRAEAFVAMRRSEDRSLAVTSLPYHRHDNRAVANTTRYPEGGTSRTLTGPEGAKGPTEGWAGQGVDAARRERANPKQPQTTKAKTPKATEEGKNNTRQRPTQTRNTTEHQQECTQTKQHPTHKDKQSRPKQITGRKTQAPAHHPEKNNEKGVHPRDRRPTRQPRRKEAKSKTE